jgi:hypothetical protein
MERSCRWLKFFKAPLTQHVFTKDLENMEVETAGIYRVHYPYDQHGSGNPQCGIAKSQTPLMPDKPG